MTGAGSRARIWPRLVLGALLTTVTLRAPAPWAWRALVPRNARTRSGHAGWVAPVRQWGPTRQTSDEVVPVALGGLLVETRELLDPAADLWTAGVVVEEIQ